MWVLFGGRGKSETVIFRYCSLRGCSFFWESDMKLGSDLCVSDTKSDMFCHDQIVSPFPPFAINVFSKFNGRGNTRCLKWMG